MKLGRSRSHGEVDGVEKNKYKDEGEGRRGRSEEGRGGTNRRSRQSPLNNQQPGVYKICNGQVAPDTVNVQNTLAVGSEQNRQFSA